MDTLTQDNEFDYLTFFKDVDSATKIDKLQ